MLFKIDWTAFDRLAIVRDRRTGDIFLVRTARTAAETHNAPLFLFENETIGL